MPVTIGEKLGPYQILVSIGEGGMGEVFRARDTRLARDVAIKVSMARFSERFDHEARAIAALNHPNMMALSILRKSGFIHSSSAEGDTFWLSLIEPTAMTGIPDSTT